MKPIVSAQEIAAKIPDGAVIMIGGFLNAPEALIDALVEAGTKDLTIIANDTNYAGVGIGKLIAARRVKKVVTSHIGTNADTQAQLAAGELEVEIVPQGTLAERVRAGGYGLGGVLTPTGVGTVVAEGKQTMVVNGREYLLELPLRADVALLQASIADKGGNLFHRKTTRNWNPLMAAAADLVIAEVRELREVGELDPDIVHTPGIFVDYLVPVEGGRSHG